MEQINIKNLPPSSQLWLKKQILKSMAAILKERGTISEERYNQLIPRFENLKR